MVFRMKHGLMLFLVLLLAVGAVPLPAMAANPITPGSLSLKPTYNSISVDLPYIGDDNQNAIATVKFKKTNDSTWRNGLDLWRWTDSAGRGFTGSILLADSGTSYNVQVIIVDSDGGGVTLNGTVTTRVDNIAEPGALTPTHYVNDATGSDSNNGQSAGTPWKSLNKAIQEANSATGDMVIRVASGYYQKPTTTLVGNGKKITLIAENLAVDNSGSITTSSHSIIYDRYVAPDGSGDTTSLGAGGWTQTNMQGAGHAQNYSGGSVPNPVPSYRVWSRDVGTNDIGTLSYATVNGTNYAGAKTSEPLRVGKWRKDSNAGTTLNTAAGFAETVYTNYTYNSGFWKDDTSNTLYLVLPDGIDPNDCYIWLASKGNDKPAAITLNGPNLRITGFSIRSFTFGINMKSAANYSIIDHNLTRNNYRGVTGDTHQAQDTNHLEDVTIQYNRFSDTNLWSTTEPVIPWVWIKGRIITGDATSYDGGLRIGDMSETTAIQAYENGAQWVIRHNVIDGQFNGVASYLSNTDRSNYYGFDIHDNTFMNMSDDALEPEGAAQNWRMWNNEIHDVFNGFSTDSSHGPYYVFRNTIWMAGAHGMSDDGHPTNPQLKGFGSMFKYGTKQVPSARWFIINNSFWTDYPKANGFVDNVNGNRQESFWLRNNLVRVPHYPLRIGGANIGGWDEDYNFFASEVTADAVFGGFKYRNVSYNLGAVTGDYSLADYRVDSGVGAHSNHAGGNDYNFVNSGDSLSGLAKLDGFLNSPTTGILTLASGSHAIDSGVVVPNIADRSGVDYNGNAPDLGAFESAGSGGSDTTAPSTPTNLSSPSKTDISVDLTWNASTDNVGVTGYDVYNNGAKSNIVNITGTSYTVTNLSPNAAYTFTVKAKDAAGNLSAASSVLQVTTQNSNPSDPDLVGYWKFNETSGITAADSSGSNNGTVINGAVWDSGGQIGGSLNFDGSNDYVSLPNIINPSAATFTASAWIYPDVSTGIRSVLVQEGTNGRKWLYREDGLLTSFLFSSKLQSTGSIVTGQWNHIAVTYDGTTLKLYLNGQQDGSATGTIESELGGMRVGIAKDDSSGWDGKIDDVRIYDRALSSTEIASLHGGDTIAPDAPTNLSSPSKTDTTVALSWTASTDNVGVTGYDVFNGGVKANTANISGTSYTVTNLSPNTAYTFTVKAKDAAGNVSAASSGLQVTTQNSNPPDPDLVGHWTFDEMSGTTASDSSGSNHGTVMNGAVWDAGGQIGGALNFDGSNDYVSLPNIINPSTTAFTASAWIYSDVSTGIRSVLVQEGSNGKKWLYREDGLLTTFLLGTKLQSTGLIVNGQWNHIAVTYDGTTITLYLNGQSDGATTIGTIESETGGMRIGIAKDGSTMFDGKIDDLRIYDTALSESAITALYNDGL